MADGLDLADEYHRNLPLRIRDYLRQTRGISGAVIDRHLLGWNGNRITIPILDRDGQCAFFKLAKDPDDKSDSPKILATLGAHVELYDWQTVLTKPGQIVICEGEFDKLVLETQGLTAVTSTGGAATFRPEWAEAFLEIPCVFICFDNDLAGRLGVERVAHLVPHARIVRLPEEVGDGGDVTDFFVRLGRSREDFVGLVDKAEPLSEANRAVPQPPSRLPRTSSDEVEQLKSAVALEDLIARYVPLRVAGQNYTGCCPFHEDRSPSFVVYPRTQTFYCFGCREHGDVLSFLMRQEHLTFPEALKVLRELNNSNGAQAH